MAYLGNTVTTQGFTPAVDFFSGNASTTAFTLSRPVASVAQIEAVISNVPQTPGTAYTVSGNTITFTSAPPTGTNNIYVYYTSPITQVIQPSQGTVGQTQMANPTGTGNPVLQTSPTITTPTIDTITSAASTALTLKSAGTTAMTIDTSQNVGIGVVPSAWQTAFKALDIGSGSSVSNPNSSGQTWLATNAYYNSGWKYKNSTSATLYETDSAHKWYIAASGTAGNAITFTQAMTLDSSGNLLVGRTSGNGSTKTLIQQNDNSNADSYSGLDIYKGSATTTTAQVFQRFFVSNGSGGNGSITANGAAAATFTAYSDSRLKENIVDLPSQLANIMALRPVEFDYKGYENGEGHQIGFIAQEVQQIYPDLVAEGDDGMLMLSDMNKNDARLIKAIQELKALVDAQATEIAQLKAKVG